MNPQSAEAVRPLERFIGGYRQVYVCPICRCLLLEREDDFEIHLAEMHGEKT